MGLFNLISSNVSQTDLTCDDYTVYSIIIDNYIELNEELKKIINNHRELYPLTNQSNVRAWHSNWKSHEDNIQFNLVVDKVLGLCKLLSQEHFQREIDFECQDMWAIQYEKGEYTTKHSHHPADLSCVYYVDVEPDCSPIIFEGGLEVTPTNGMLLIFSAAINHEVPPTKSRRTVISMNMNEKGKHKNLITRDENISAVPISMPNSEEDQKIFLQQQLESFLTNDISDILDNYKSDKTTNNNADDQVLEIYKIFESTNINLTEEDIFNFLQIENRWPYKYFRDVENPQSGPSSIYGFDTPIQVITKENHVEKDSFYSKTGTFIFDEWKKYYDFGFTTMISDVLDLTPELRKLRSEILKISGMKVYGNFYLTNGGKKVQSSWLPHNHHYNVIVKIIYGDTTWKISDNNFNYSEGDVILIPPETYHSVIECPNKRLSLTVNLF